MSFGKNDSHSNNTSTQNQNFSGTDNYTGLTNFNQNSTGAQNTTGTQTATPTNPDWVSTIAQALAGNGAALGGANPQSFVAGPSSLQTEAGNTVGSLTGSPWNYNGAADLARSAGDTSFAAPIMASDPLTVSGGKGYNYISNYLDPATNDVVNATLADFDHQAGLTRAQQALSLAGSGAFGGSGAALTQAATEDNLARARATTDAGLRQQAFSQAVSAASADADRATQAREANAANQLESNQLKAQLGLGVGQQQLAAAHGLTDISGAYDQNRIADANAQAGIGSQLQQISQQFAQAPLAVQQALVSMFSGLPLNLFHGETDNTVQNQTSSQNQTGTQNESGTENQSGTSSGTSTGNSSGSNFGFGFKLFGQ